MQQYVPFTLTPLSLCHFTVSDQSWIRCQELVSNALPGLPADITQLAAVLAAPPTVKIPVTVPDVVKQLEVAGLADMFEYNNTTAAGLATCVTSALTTLLTGLDQEPFTAFAVNTCIIQLMFEIDKRLKGHGQELNLHPKRDRQDTGALILIPLYL